jgi:hypothetical protein
MSYSFLILYIICNMKSDHGGSAALKLALYVLSCTVAGWKRSQRRMKTQSAGLNLRIIWGEKFLCQILKTRDTFQLLGKEGTHKTLAWKGFYLKSHDRKYYAVFFKCVEFRPDLHRKIRTLGDFKCLYKSWMIGTVEQLLLVVVCMQLDPPLQHRKYNNNNSLDVQSFYVQSK